MEILYNKQYLKELYEEGMTSDKTHRYQPEVVMKYRRRIDTLIAANRKEDLFVFQSLHFEALQGTDLYSIRVDLKYRLLFSLTEIGAQETLTICNIEEITNHYQ